MIYLLEDVRLIDFSLFDARESFLVVYDSQTNVPFKIDRIFMVKSIEKSIRGHHSHKECSQLLVVLNGECEVTCDDGEKRQTFILNKSCQGLLVPPTIWAEQTYHPNTILMVLTDRSYEAADYIRDYGEFIKFRGNK